MAAVLTAFAGPPLVGPAPVAAQPSAAPDEAAGDQTDAPEPMQGEEVCTVTDHRLTELSGLISLDDGFIVVNDSQDLDERKPIFLLDHSCNVVDLIPFPTPPLDPEDLAYDRERQILWVGDIGDNVAGGLAAGGTPRHTVALWRVDLSGGDRTPLIHRFVYPDGQPRDAEALVLEADGTPIIVTKNVGTAELFRPTEFIPQNPPEQGVPLEKVGEFTPPESQSEHYLSALSVAGRRVVTGGANSPDGSKVALRTYTDILEFDVVDGDVVTSIVEGEPRVTSLAPQIAEIQGEAVAYSADGERFLTVSDAPPAEMDLPEPFVPTILSYTPFAPPPPPPSPEPGASGGSGGGSLFSFSLNKIMLVIAVVGVLGLVMVGVGVMGIVRARRRAVDPSGVDAVPSQTRGVVSVGAIGAVSPAVAAAAAAVPATGGAGTVYGGAARVPAPAPPADDAPGWEPDVAEQPGVYRSSAGTYQGGEYGGTTYGGQYDDSGHYAHGDDDQSAAAYEGGTYQAAGYDYDAAGYPIEADQEGPADYDGGVYRSSQEVDDYYDDPDYSYEFRDPGSERY